MDDAALVRPLQSLANFDAVFQNLLGRQRTFTQAVGESLAFQKLHDQEIDTILMTDIMQSADVGMVQRRDGPGFAVETLFGFDIVGKMAGEDFDRDRAVEASILRPINLSHAASPQG